MSQRQASSESMSQLQWHKHHRDVPSSGIASVTHAATTAVTPAHSKPRMQHLKSVLS
jgi:hypothetical protein